MVNGSTINQKLNYKGELEKIGDRIKRLKLRHCGKLDFTCNGKLRPLQFIHCGAARFYLQRQAAAAAAHPLRRRST